MYGNKHVGKDNNDSGFGKKKSEDTMTSIALKEAKSWLVKLMDREFKGRGDRDYMIRDRLATATGIPESYLYRLQHKTRGMKDVAGEAYRRLKLAYENICEKNEEAADRYKAERLSMDGINETAVEEPHASGVGTVSAGAATTTPPGGERAEGVMR
ncbi:hypothetical protein [Shinella sp. JR1-6]|uniref:hypothetical protein n=1 Tax=Shinella sp. JR1-6 TaxID=2527671 RepID=UPI00102D58AB|nr:hypothetical protein [Shinella sp. JR1-6]TAA49121.1 hypothetical protein EXZ48_34545 [Shinella sp. JR1-6]